MAKPQVNVAPQRKGTNVITGCVRLAFQSVIEPRVSDISDDKTPKYAAVLLFEPNDPTIPLMKAAMKEAATEFFGENKIPAGLRNPIRNGDEKAAEYPFYAGHLFVNTSTKNKPGVVDQRNKAITDADDIYSGCWVRAEINCFAYDRKGNKGVSFGLNNMQKLGDDERFGGRRPAEQVFAPVVDAANPFEGSTAAEDGVDPFA
jgi:Protein of unknown function (DUF2815)